jgi:hypothetical protein
MTHVMLKKICKNLNMPIELELSSRYALYPVVLVCALFVSLTFLNLLHSACDALAVQHERH